MRPLLDVERQDVIRFLRSRDIGTAWIARTGARASHAIASAAACSRSLPANSIPRSTVHSDGPPICFATTMRPSERQPDRCLRRIRSSVGLDCDRLSRLAPALQRRVVRLWIESERGDLRAVRLEHVERIRAAALEGHDGSRISLPGGIVTRAFGRLGWGIVAPARRRAFVRTLPARRSLTSRRVVLRGARNPSPRRANPLERRLRPGRTRRPAARGAQPETRRSRQTARARRDKEASGRLRGCQGAACRSVRVAGGHGRRCRRVGAGAGSRGRGARQRAEQMAARGAGATRAALSRSPRVAAPIPMC